MGLGRRRGGEDRKEAKRDRIRFEMQRLRENNSGRRIDCKIETPLICLIVFV